MQILLSSPVRAVAVFLAAMLLSGCFAKRDSARSKLRSYLELYSSGKLSSNALAASDYELMLGRLDASQDPYVYLFHERIGNQLVVYWFGVDEFANEIEVVFEDGTVLHSNPSEYRVGNKQSLSIGEPQYFSISIADRVDVSKVVKIRVSNRSNGESSRERRRLAPGADAGFGIEGQLKSESGV
ncbi:hypothetical protein [Neorhodopirellula pilleata]|uniref:Uncharacterized protein n=1 Tax=Neorhodopirellula pilleata TaxID=2714738 RepID=A0A5C5ZQN2_9BACT|nr:hypothetical protein [Neorhodopirellula pilleata]TWT89570.1 hypothetical protein Pla100_54990 [Neorhodopirellula pilleata]